VVSVGMMSLRLMVAQSDALMLHGAGGTCVIHPPYIPPRCHVEFLKHNKTISRFRRYSPRGSVTEVYSADIPEEPLVTFLLPSYPTREVAWLSTIRRIPHTVVGVVVVRRNTQPYPFLRILYSNAIPMKRWAFPLTVIKYLHDSHNYLFLPYPIGRQRRIE